MKIILVILLSLSIIACTHNKNKEQIKEREAKSSDIPKRREFPVNPNINPCQDFYQYACSKVIDSFELRPDRSSHTFAFSDSHERLLDFKKEYFKNLAKTKAKSELEVEIKSYYMACMNEDSRKKEELSFALKTKQKLDSIKSHKEFQQFIAKQMTSFNEISFLEFNANLENQDKPLYRDVYFDTKLMTLPERSYYENKDLTAKLIELQSEFFKLMGSQNPKEAALAVFNFEKQLAKDYPLPEEFRNKMTERHNISKEELYKKYPNLDLKQILNKIPEKTIIRDLLGESTMMYLNNSLQDLSLETLKNIYLFFLVSPYLDDAFPEYMKMKFNFNHEFLGGPFSRPVREERCTRTVMKHFMMELDSILLPKIFPNFPKKKFNKSVEKIRKSLIEQLTENTWLDPESKKAAIKKVKKVHFMLVSPNNKDEWNFHPRAVYSHKTPIANELKLAVLNKQKELKELKGPISPRRWGMGPLTVNAYYNPTFNHIVFPVGILQYPFYDPNEPEEANLGAVGAVIAHELGHGVDDEGSKFDEQGRLHEWMTAKDRENFIQRGSKLVDQFNKIGHNGKLTLGENIGDLVGVTTAYRAAHPKTAKEKQFFFLQYARVYCGVARPSYQELLLKTDPHSLDFARVNEQMKNQKGFQEAFSCPAGSPMTLPEKDQTVIW